MKKTAVIAIGLMGLMAHGAASVGYMAATNIAGRVTSNVVTKAYVEGLGISGGANTNVVNDLISAYNETNLVGRLVLKQDTLADYTTTNAVNNIIGEYNETNLVGRFAAKQDALADYTTTNAVCNIVTRATNAMEAADTSRQIVRGEYTDDNGWQIIVKLAYDAYSADNADMAFSANSADKAIKDGKNNNIVDTYATKTSVNAISNTVSFWEGYWQGDRVRQEAEALHYTNGWVAITNIVNGMADYAVEASVTNAVATAFSDMLGDNWKEQFGGGLLGIIAAIAAAIAWLKNKKANSTAVAAAWAASTAYALDAHVTYQGNAYKCTTAHTSGSTFDSTNWTAVAVYDNPDYQMLHDGNTMHVQQAVTSGGVTTFTTVWADEYKKDATSSSTFARNVVGRLTLTDTATLAGVTFPTGLDGYARDFIVMVTLPDTHASITTTPIDWPNVTYTWLGTSPFAAFNYSTDAGKTFVFTFTDMADGTMLVSRNELKGLPTVTTTSVSAATSQTLSGTFLAGTTAIEYSTDGTTFTAFTTKSVVSDHSVTVDCSGLTASTSYTFRVTTGTGTWTGTITTAA